jgi:hypothetical protein
MQVLRTHFVSFPEILGLNYDARVDEVLPVTLRGADVFDSHGHVLLDVLAR